MQKKLNYNIHKNKYTTNNREKLKIMMKLKLNIRKKAIKNSIIIILMLNLTILQFGLNFNLSNNNSGFIPKNNTKSFSSLGKSKLNKLSDK